MIIDGKKIANEIIADISESVTNSSIKPTAVVITCAPNFETAKYLKMKVKKAKQCGIGLSVVEFSADTTTAEIISSIDRLKQQADAVVVQLPLPDTIDTDAVLQSVPVEKDADGLCGGDKVFSPVVGAIDVIASREKIDFKDKQVVVVGKGRLVGLPALKYAKEKGADVSVLTIDSTDTEEKIASADILILGAGVPTMVKPHMIKEGVVIFDAGTSEDNGELVGDAHPDCAQVASLTTPVPGGIGPLTIAMLLKNITILANANSEK